MGFEYCSWKHHSFEVPYEEMRSGIKLHEDGTKTHESIACPECWKEMNDLASKAGEELKRLSPEEIKERLQKITNDLKRKL